MRDLTALLLLATPLGAQTPTIAPAASVLFHSPSVVPAGDPVTVGTGMSQQTGAIIGFLVGAGLGYSLVAMSQSRGCNPINVGGGGGGGGGCEDGTPTMPRVLGAIIGGLAGVVVGSLIAGPDAPAPR